MIASMIRQLSRQSTTLLMLGSWVRAPSGSLTKKGLHQKSFFVCHTIIQIYRPCHIWFISSIFPVEMRQSHHAIIQAQSCWMFTLIHNRLLLIHNRSLHIHFGSENRHEIVSQANIRCNVVRLCTPHVVRLQELMSYVHSISCRTT